jgi:hypothetical protein
MVSGSKVGGQLRCNEHARWPTPWHVVNCEKMLERRRAPPGVQPSKNDVAAVGLGWNG